ncbi:threonine ammonia-lyase [Haloferax sp. Atlit-10N]|uniref:threonine ammonia-lyase n=1 Tax=Haloferax prahovense (strain DSM 18310 / JCM 13924 / TL6) TaxID=1227461 RepID=M0GKM9_HALPT|nr:MULTISPECIES: threonine ammonia-lyase [Haloferax]ELZ72801.1 threonine ammonia-lyase [Haloferax prahovense DSM 18310]RDZ43875.1 threonine ammonia-lyase [Haloferax sp. Atlit-19N]RDZ46250.1 threonine ammonia-lyase [Haloferax sp. Atlit-16N]RDZ60083.1 threonine ammonia-lyase [Haloferax sp. Atlit-10N]
MLTLDDVRAARERVEAVARWTPLEYSHTFSEMTGAEVYLKLENSQRTGSFKIRGATNRITTLSDEEKDAGVVTASAGNHAQGVALAASRAGVNSKIVMPEYAPISKVKATERYGGDVVLYGNDYDEAQAKAHEIEADEGRTYVHAFDDEYVMAGQGTIGLEIAEDCPDLDTVVVPIGGGGLISGISTAIKAQFPDVRVIGVQAEQASSAADSLNKGSIQTIDEVDTIADGIAVRRIGDKPFEVIRERVDEVVTVSDEEIAVALTYLLERSKTLVEGAGAVALAALVFQKFDYEEGEVVVPALCGGNIDMNTLTTVVMRGLVETGRYLKIRTELKDRPGSLEQLIEIIAAEKANIYAVRHDRTSRKIALNATEVEIDLEMRGPDHVDSLLGELRDAGYDVEVLD